MSSLHVECYDYKQIVIRITLTPLNIFNKTFICAMLSIDTESISLFSAVERRFI